MLCRPCRCKLTSKTDSHAFFIYGDRLFKLLLQLKNYRYLVSTNYPATCLKEPVGAGWRLVTSAARARVNRNRERRIFGPCNKGGGVTLEHEQVMTKNSRIKSAHIATGRDIMQPSQWEYQDSSPYCSRLAASQEPKKRRPLYRKQENTHPQAR